MIDIRLTKTTAGYYDLNLEGGLFTLAEDGTQTAQHCMIRINCFKGHYSLNDMLSNKDNDGTDFYGIIFNMEKSQAEKELELKRRILTTPEVEKILDFTWTQTGRSVSITGSVQTEYGVADISQVISIL